MCNWYPIETAPKDGTLIDLWSDTADDRFPDCKWENGAWREWFIDSFDSLSWVKIEYHVTHWMPKPKGPIIEKSSEECYYNTPNL